MNQTDQQPAERRPITTRETRGAKRVAGWLSRRGIRPNTISVAGMIAGILAGAALAATSHWPEAAPYAWIVGGVLIQVRLLANMFDGMVAVETKQVSSLGELYNEVPDRVSDVATLVGLGYAAGSNITLGYTAACLAVFVAYVRATGKAAGGDQEFCGPMAKPQRMFLVTVTALYCGLAPSSWLPDATAPGGWGAAGASGIGTWGIGTWALVVIIAGCGITAVRRLLRIATTLRKSQESHRS